MSEEKTNLIGSLENDFKIAKVLQLQNRSDQAIKKYVHIIHSYENIARQEPNSATDYLIVALSIGCLVDIYKNQKELDKALSLLSVQKKFIEHIAATKSTVSSDEINSLNSENFHACEHNIVALFEEVSQILLVPNSPPPKKPEELIDDFLKEKKRQENKESEQNMLRLLHLVEEKKKRLKNSRFERWTDWINNNPIAMLVFAMVFLAVFLIFIFTQFRMDQPDREKMKQKVDKNLKENQPPKLSREEFNELSKKLRKMSTERFQQNLNDRKDNFDELINQMKQKYKGKLPNLDDL